MSQELIYSCCTFPSRNDHFVHDLSTGGQVASIIILTEKPLTLWKVLHICQGTRIFLFSKRAKPEPSETDLWFLRGIGPTFKKS